MNAFKICSQFGIEIVAKKDIVKGLINNTSLVTDNKGKKYILQEINKNVFKDVDKLMNNIDLVTNYLREKIRQENGDPTTGTINLLKSRDGKSYITTVDENNATHYYRMYNYIDNAASYDEANEELLYQAGVGFGRFQRQLSNFPADKLYESIPDFHNTVARYKQFTSALERCTNDDKKSTVIKASPEISYALYKKNYAGLIMDALTNQQIPLRVVHNDTKLNNVMLDSVTHQPVCVIDLDTIMPGSLLFDYGDAIRHGANTGLEDDINLKNVKLDINKFKAFTNGFLKETANSLTKKELELLPQAPIVLAYELGLRFLTDYLDGNKYFRCDSSRPDHNLERARSQFKLMSNMIEQLPIMTHIINDLYSRHISGKIK